MLAHQLKAMLKAALPYRVHFKLKEIIGRPREAAARRAQSALHSAALKPDALGDEEFYALLKSYPWPPPYGWDKNTLITRGKARAKELRSLPGAERANRFLEIGCWDGMVSGCLAEDGADATAIDYRDIGFDDRAVAMGAKLMQMDASSMRFPDATFDLVFSYDAVEHVRWPDTVLREALRVLKPGGLAFLNYGPLYNSPLGEHAYDSIPIPYCQFLFSEAQINAYAAKLGKPLIDFEHVNRWGLAQYRKLWSDLEPLAEVVFCFESRELRHLSLIETYPSHFRAVSTDIDEFLVDNIRILLRRR